MTFSNQGGQKDLRGSIAVVMVVVTIIWLCSIFGAFRLLNLFLYSNGVGWLAVTNESPLIVVSHQTGSNGYALEDLLEQIQSYQPKKILLLVEEKPKNIASSVELSIIAVPKRRSDGRGEKEWIMPVGLDRAAIEPRLIYGVALSAVLRHENTMTDDLSSFLLDINPSLLGEGYLINFDKLSPYIAVIDSSQIRAKNIVPQLFANKIVVIGSDRLAAQRNLSTSLSGGSFAVSLLQFHAMTVEAVMRDAELKEAGPFWTLLMISASVVFFMLVTRATGLLNRQLFLVSLLIVGLAILLIVSYFLGRVQPMVEFFVAIFASVLISSQNMQRLIDAESVQLSLIIREKLRSSILQQNFNESHDPWLEIATMVQQYLQLDKTIFTEKVPDDHRIKEIYALGCALEDIEEMRRDYERAPYSSALKESAPIEIERPYFKNKSDGEREFIVPLAFAGEVLGFWAMTTCPNAGWNQTKFLFNVQSFAEQISQLLYRRQSFQRDVSSNQGRLQRSMARLFPPTSNNSLKFYVHSSIARLSLLQSIFSALHSAAIIYDLFGRLVEVNHSMEVLADRCDLNIFNTNTLELLASITGLSHNNVRARLRHVIFTQEMTHFAPGKLAEYTYMVSVTPVSAGKDTPLELLDPSTPFSVIGLLVEFINVGSMTQLMNTERNVNQQYLEGVEQSLKNLQSLQLELRSGAAVGDSRTEGLLDGIQQQLNFTQKNTLMQRQLQENFASEGGADYLPVDVFNLYSSAVDSLGAKLELKQVQLELNFPDTSALVLAAYDTLLTMLKLIFAVLIEDAQRGSILRVRGKFKQVDDEKFFYLLIANTGFGFPAEVIGVNDEADGLENVASQVRQIKTLFGNLPGWHGRGSFRSKLGDGICFSIVLKGISLGA